MKKRVKKLKLNTTNRAHTSLMLRNMFTSLVLHGKVVTTTAKAKTLKSYAEKTINRYARLKSSWEKKRWLTANILTKAFEIKAKDKLEAFVTSGYKISNKRIGFRKGDGAELTRLEIVALKPKQEDISTKSKPKKKEETKTTKTKQVAKKKLDK